MADHRTLSEAPVPEPDGSWTEQAATPGRGPRRWAVTIVAGGMVAVLLAVSLAGFRFVLSDPLPAAYGDPVLAVESGPGSWPAAPVTGELQRQDGCLLVDDAVAMFPDGTTWAEPGRVVFADGTTWRLGQRIVGRGGFLSAGSVTGTDLGDEATAAAATCAEDLGLTAVVQVMP